MKLVIVVVRKLKVERDPFVFVLLKPKLPISFPQLMIKIKKVPLPFVTSKDL